MTATERALELTHVAATAAVDKLGTDLVAYDVSEQLAITDVFLVITAFLSLMGMMAPPRQPEADGLNSKPTY